MNDDGQPDDEDRGEETASPSPHEFGFRRAAAKVREFPQEPGVYLFKDSAGVVIYVGKAKNLRSRAGSYFLKAAEVEQRTASWVHDICDADFLQCESEVDAVLAESRFVNWGVSTSPYTGPPGRVGYQSPVYRYCVASRRRREALYTTTTTETDG